MGMRGLRGGLTRRRLAARLRKASFGLLGDVRPVGSGVMEMREHFGPGWRMYYVQHASVMIVVRGRQILTAGRYRQSASFGPTIGVIEHDSEKDQDQ